MSLHRTCSFAENECAMASRGDVQGLLLCKQGYSIFKVTYIAVYCAVALQCKHPSIVPDFRSN